MVVCKSRIIYNIISLFLYATKPEAFRQLLTPSGVTPARVTPLKPGLFFRFAFCGTVTTGSVVRDCETILGLKN